MKFSLGQIVLIFTRLIQLAESLDFQWATELWFYFCQTVSIFTRLKNGFHSIPIINCLAVGSWVGQGGKQNLHCNHISRTAHKLHQWNTNTGLIILLIVAWISIRKKMIYPALCETDWWSLEVTSHCIVLVKLLFVRQFISALIASQYTPPPAAIITILAMFQDRMEIMWVPISKFQFKRRTWFELNQNLWLF